MPDVRELGRKVKAKYPGKYDDLADEDVGRKVKAKYPGAYNDFTDTPAAQPPQPEGIFSSFQTGVAGPLLRNVVETASDFYNAPGETLERVGRGALEFASAFDPASNAYEATVKSQATRGAELNRRADERLPENVQLMKRGMAIEEAKPRTRGGRIAGAVGSVLGEVAFPTAPESAAANIVTAPFAGVAVRSAGQTFRAGVNAVRRRFGKGAAQIIEAEATPAATAQVRQAIDDTVPMTEELPARPTAPLPAQLQGTLGATTSPLPGPPPVPPSTPGFAESMVQSRFPRQRNAPDMVMPANPNPIQQAGVLPRVFGEAEEAATRPEIAAGMARLQRTPGAPVSLTQLREQFPGMGKQQFDDEVARLADEGEIFVHKHDAPGQLTDAQRGSLVKIGDDYYPAATFNPSARTGPPPLEADLGPQSFGVQAAPDLPVSTTTGPSVQGALAMEARAPGATPALNAPVGDVPIGFGDAVPGGQQPLFTYAPTVAVPRQVLQRAKDELLGGLGALKSLKSSFDISAPFRQGSLLMLPPTKWKQAGRAWANMFKAFKSKDFEAIKKGIDYHPDLKTMDEAGLFLANRTDEAINRGEEAFLRRSGSKISEIVGKTPGIKQSDQMYKTFLDTQRVERFVQYKNIIDKAGLSPTDAQKGYKAAAEWINIASGRGSLGQRFDKSFDALSFFLFSPRYVASRLNVFNPVMYARNASTPGGRVILKEQMKELVQYAGVVASTFGLAKAAGADVGLNPNDSDFLKVKFGNWRYDPLAGLQQVMRMIYRVGADIGRAASGEKPKAGKTAIDIGETFLSYKLSPPAAVFRNFINQRTVDRKPFTYGGAAVDLVAPIQWADFVEAYQQEGWGGVAKASPGLVGIGANLQGPSSPVDAAIEKSQPIFSELQRLNKRVSDLRQREGEPEAAFKLRVQQFGQNYTLYGQRLLDSPRFQSASDDVKNLALDRLNERAKSITTRETALPEIELDANLLLDSAEASTKNPANKSPGRY